MTNYNDGKWHGWNGGECPVHTNTKVQWTRKDNDGGTHKAGELVWGDRTGIVAFRAIREPREFWVDPERCISVPSYHAGLHPRPRGDGMKFAYDSKPDDRECVAYIDQSGELIVSMSKEVNGEGAVWFASDGWVETFSWNPDNEATHKFYPGDSITITF